MTYSLTLITPQAVFFHGLVSSMTAVSVIGSFGVLAHHAPMITLLQAGRLTLTLEDDTKQVYQIGSGFLDVRNNKAILLTTSIQNLATP